MFESPNTFTDVVLSYLLQVSHAIGCSETGFQQVIVDCIMKFLPGIFRPSDMISFSDDFWCRLMLQCFDIRMVRSKEMRDVLERLPNRRRG